MSRKKLFIFLIIIFLIAGCSREYRMNYFMNRGFTEDEAERIIEKKLKIGDSKKMVERIRERPTRTTRDITNRQVYETWWWYNRRGETYYNYIKFLNGKITNMGWL